MLMGSRAQKQIRLPKASSWVSNIWQSPAES
nr:MAG TPA: hypothetical protein [Caudoviricetes sp.]